MTTAHKPTWKAAYGLSDTVKGYVPTRSYSARVITPYYIRIYQVTWNSKTGKLVKEPSKNSKKKISKQNYSSNKLKTNAKKMETLKSSKLFKSKIMASKEL